MRVCVEPADGHHHGIVFDLFKLASVFQSLKHSFPRLETLHTLQATKVNCILIYYYQIN